MKELMETTVSPAPAGMIPAASGYTSTPSSEPRTRGDDPVYYVKKKGGWE